MPKKSIPTPIHDKQREIKALLNKLDAVYLDWEKNRPKPKSGYADAATVIHKSLSLAFCIDTERRKELETLLNPEPDVIDISVSPTELLSILIGLVLLMQSLEAERFVKDSIGKGVSNEKRWSKVAEMMFIKDPAEKLRRHGNAELIAYWVRIDHGMTPRKASEEVFKKFKFNSQMACDKWLRREIERKQREKQKGVPNLFADLPKPSTSP